MVVKSNAKPAFEESFALAIRHGKMTTERQEELMSKIVKAVSNDPTAFAGTESDIRVSRNGEASGEMMIDMVVHHMKIDGDNEDYMSVSYAAAKCSIEHATIEQQQNVEQLIQKIISSTLKGLILPGGEAERIQIEERLME